MKYPVVKKQKNFALFIAPVSVAVVLFQASGIHDWGRKYEYLLTDFIFILHYDRYCLKYYPITTFAGGLYPVFGRFHNNLMILLGECVFSIFRSCCSTCFYLSFLIALYITLKPRPFKDGQQLLLLVCFLYVSNFFTFGRT